ncbi:MAG: acyl-[acyl-carrier-protein] thioesterase [Acidobacteriota bacterium]
MAGKTEARPVWSGSLQVRSYEVGGGAAATPLALADWFQEAAGNHATSLGWAVDQLAQRGLTWVLARLHLNVASFPIWRETVTVETWPAGIDRLYALREFRVTGEDGRACVLATSGWLLLGLANRRPVRPPREISDIAANTPGRLLDDHFAKLPELDRVDHRHGFETRFFDIDLNHHVNNVAVIAWLLEACPPELLRGGALAELEVEFRAEAMLGDEIVAEVGRTAEDAFLHRIVRPSDGKEIARARSSWRRS